MSNAKFNLIVVAHPDDETIYFGGLLQKLRNHPWRVICITDGNADQQGLRRREQFREAMRLLKVNVAEMWDFPDIYERRLDISSIATRLRTYKPEKVFTHGVLGEYGHPHHQDVSMAVHLAFAKKGVLSVAHNCFPDFNVALTQRQFALKAKILSTVYYSETRRFVDFLPATAIEGFAKIPFNDVEKIYMWLAEGKKPELLKSKKYGWYFPYFADRSAQPPPRPF